MSVYIKEKLITVDGPGGVGKGTLSRLLAKELGWDYLDSGALYRLCAYKAQKERVALDDVPALVSIAKHLNILFALDASEAEPCVWLDNEVVNEFIRTEHCGQAASKIAVIPDVRDALLTRQRHFLSEKGLVADGRDMGTVVFKEAPLKFYLTASAKVRANRRKAQLDALGMQVNIEQLIDDIRVRDDRDQKRAISPMKPADDAILLDTSNMSIQDVSDKMMLMVKDVFSI